MNMKNIVETILGNLVHQVVHIDSPPIECACTDGSRCRFIEF